MLMKEFNGHELLFDGQIFKAMARATALSAVPRQDGADDERGLQLVSRDR